MYHTDSDFTDIINISYKYIQYSTYITEATIDSIFYNFYGLQTVQQYSTDWKVAKRSSAKTLVWDLLQLQLQLKHLDSDLRLRLKLKLKNLS